jgi:prepilin-type N-terminal cleavage/methylation domain-containing protein
MNARGLPSLFGFSSRTRDLNRAVGPSVFASSRGFTLIELMIVIAIIALLAALVVGLAGGASESSIRKAASGLLATLETAVDGYKADLGFFPPDNLAMGKPNRPPIYYSLRGGIRTVSGDLVMEDNNSITSNQIYSAFGLGGIVNSSPAGRPKTAKDYLKGLKPGNIKEEAGVKYVVFPRKGPDGDFNPVRYDASSANRHNLDSYDVWIDVMIGGKQVTIGNW